MAPTPEERIRKLREALRYHEERYYIFNAPEISDEAFDRLLTETDSPFLAPVPHRGKRNEPAHVTRVVAALADLYDISAGELAKRTAANFHTLFGP